MEISPGVWEKLEDEEIVAKLAIAAMRDIKLLCADLDQPRTGGTITIARATDGMPILKIPVGQVTPDKAEKYSYFSQEKCGRLAHLHVTAGHVTSGESRDENKQQYDGALLFMEGVIVSFSGLPEELDLLLSTHLGQLVLGLTPMKRTD